WPWIGHSLSGLLHATGRPVQTRFRSGSVLHRLNLATCTKLVGSFFKRHAIRLPASRQHPLTACRHEVSGTISLPFRGAFHLSLTVLVHYRSPRVFSLGRWSAQLPT